MFPVSRDRERDHMRKPRNQNITEPQPHRNLEDKLKKKKKNPQNSEGKHFQPIIRYPAKLSVKLKVRIMIFLDT